MSPARAAATVAALSDDPRLVRIARTHLDAAVAARSEEAMSEASVPLAELEEPSPERVDEHAERELRYATMDGSTTVIDGVPHHREGEKWVPTPPSHVQVGESLRDGAVDARPGDIGTWVLDPDNPDRDPMGSNVVNAEVGSIAWQQQVDAARRARGEDV